MILIDFNACVISALIAHLSSTPGERVSESLVRHIVLANLLSYRRKFKKDFGTTMVLCCEGGSWRKAIFPYYKAKRKKDRDASKYNWTQIYGFMNTISDELEKTFPYKVIRVTGAEADDIIGTLVRRHQPTHMSPDKCENIVIVSSDKDFLQLQRFPNVSQWSPREKKFVTCKNPERTLLEHIFRGDPGDGIPNFLSDSDTFTNKDKRQTALTARKLGKYINLDYEDFGDQRLTDNFLRNAELIDLSRTPTYIQDEIMSAYENCETGDKKNLYKYFMNHRLRHLLQDISDF